MDEIARRQIRSWLANEGIVEGPEAVVRVNRRLYDISGSGNYKIPDVFIPGANIIFEGTISRKTIATAQISYFRLFSGGANILIVRPTRLGGSYGLIF